MSGSSLGSNFKVTTWGESHGKAIGAVIDGCPAKLGITESDIQKELDRRRPGQSGITTQRKESDTVQIMSGIFEGKTTGAPISLLIMNKDADPIAYEHLKGVFRPGHSDRAYLEKYGIRDHLGGGRASGRETAARVAAGAIAKKVLASKGITIIGYTEKIGPVKAENIDEDEIEKNPVRCPDKESAKKMEQAIIDARAEKDSLGGIARFIVRGCPTGLGEPCFEKLDAELAKALMSIGTVKGVEIGSGFSCAEMKGPEHNDQMDESGYLSNNAGGILGGISTGQDILIRVAVKPTSSIAKEQKTLTTDYKETTISIKGRHDPCIVPRLVPVGEAMIALVLADRIR